VGLDNYNTGWERWNTGVPQETLLHKGLAATGAPSPVVNGLDLTINVATGLPWGSAAATSAAGTRLAISGFAAEGGGATFGKAVTNDYRGTFFEANPELEGQVVVHHAVPQRTLSLYPDAVTESEIHSLENLRGIPNEVNSDVHLSQIAKEWNQFYKANPEATQTQLLQKATEIDLKYGGQFKPPVGGGP
jgi:hypothetical protein